MFSFKDFGGSCSPRLIIFRNRAEKLRPTVADPGISKRGGGAVKFLGLGFVFYAPSHIPYVFVARVVNKIHNVNIVYWLKPKYMRVIQSKFTKTNPYFFFKTGGGGRGGRRSWIRLWPMLVPFAGFEQ